MNRRIPPVVVLALMACSGGPSGPSFEASLEPESIEIDEGQIADLVLTFSNEPEGSTTAWACTSGSDSVTATETASGCRVIGRAEGIAIVQAVVTSGDAMTATRVTVQVRAPTPLAAELQPDVFLMDEDDSVELALHISGGSPFTEAIWTCTEKSAPIMVETSEHGCTVTSSEEGSGTVTAVVTRGSQTTKAHSSVHVFPVAGKSRDNAAFLMQTVRVVVESPSIPRTVVFLTLIETVSGPEALQTVLEWEQTNEVPPPGFEYILGRFVVGVVSQEDPSEAFEVDSFDFESVSGTGLVYDGFSACCAEPGISGEGFEGAIWEGWVAFEAAVSDLGTVAVYRRGDAIAEAWFELR